MLPYLFELGFSIVDIAIGLAVVGVGVDVTPRAGRRFRELQQRARARRSRS
jgi:hypothetical protein